MSSPRLTVCNDAACYGGGEISRNLRALANDPGQNAFAVSAMLLGGDIVAAWKSTASNIAAFGRCDSAECANIAPMGGLSSGTELLGLDIVATGNGIVAALHSATGLRLGHCPAGNCSGQQALLIPSLGSERPGLHPVFALDENGLPVLASLDALNGTIWVIHCNDAACAGNDEAVNKVGIGGPPIVVRTDALAMTLRDGLLPVIAAFSANNSGVTIISCNDSLCEGNDETQHMSLGANTGGGLGVVIGSDGLPAISFAETVDGSVKFAKCQSDDCSFMSPWVTVHDRNTTIDGLDMILGTDGNPLIAYSDASGGFLRVVKCANRSCQ